MIQHILVPTDLGEPSEPAIDLGTDLAKKFESELTLLHVYEVPMYAYSAMAYTTAADLLAPMEAAAREKLEARLTVLRKQLPRAKAILRTGTPWEEILAAIAESKADLVVMGTHGRRGVTHALLGSVAEKMVRLSPIPVLTVRAAA